MKFLQGRVSRQRSLSQLTTLLEEEEEEEEEEQEINQTVVGLKVEPKAT